MELKEFETGDLYLASAISLLLTTKPKFKTEGKKVLFVYPISDDLYKAMNQFNNGILVNAYEYSLVIKRMRAEMLMRRGMEEQR